jgi:dCMP deaminase
MSEKLVHFGDKHTMEGWGAEKYKNDVANQEKWDMRFLKIAREVSTWSKDPSTQTGAVLARGKRLVATGFNGFAQGMDDNPELYADREKKYDRIIHCEMNACTTAAKEGASTEGCTLYTYPFFSCTRCAVHMVQFGIIRFVSPMCPDHLEDRWGEALKRAQSYVLEAGLRLRLVPQVDD